MSMYLNTSDAYVLYKSQVESPCFADKTKLLLELIPLARQGNQHICITRPRRMGEQKRRAGRILAVGISYDRKTKKHRCKIEILQGE